MNIKREKHLLNFGSSGAYLRFEIGAALRLAEDYSIELYSPGAWNNMYEVFLEGLRSFMKENSFSDEIALSIIKSIPPKEAAKHISTALLLSLPDTKAQNSEKEEKSVDFKFFRLIFCDIMGKPDELFYKSTLREVCERWDLFAVHKGWKNAPTEIKKVYER
jgi:hypothetical protein